MIIREAHDPSKNIEPSDIPRNTQTALCIVCANVVHPYHGWSFKRQGLYVVRCKLCLKFPESFEKTRHFIFSKP